MNNRLLNYKNFSPRIADNLSMDKTSWVIGNTEINQNVSINKRVVLRGDGAEIKVGKNVIFLDRSTVHVASEMMGSYIGDNSIIGRYALVHACKIGNNVILGDQAIVMDGSNIGDNCIITANSLVPPGKSFPKNSLLSGAPAKVVGTVANSDYQKFKKEIIEKNIVKSLVRAKLEGSDPLAELGINPWINYKKGKENIDPEAFVAPDAILRGNITVHERASLWFSTIVSAQAGGKY